VHGAAQTMLWNAAGGRLWVSIGDRFCRQHLFELMRPRDGIVRANLVVEELRRRPISNQYTVGRAGFYIEAAAGGGSSRAQGRRGKVGRRSAGRRTAGRGRRRVA
jgi:hypothetical protein